MESDPERTAVHALEVWLAKMTDGISAAKMPIAVFRAALTLQPFLISADDR